MSAFVTITGNLTRDPEMTTIGSQQACRFSVGVRTRTKNKEDGGYKSNFYECTFFGKQAEYFTPKKVTGGYNGYARKKRTKRKWSTE